MIARTFLAAVLLALTLTASPAAAEDRTQGPQTNQPAPAPEPPAATASADVGAARLATTTTEAVCDNWRYYTRDTFQRPRSHPGRVRLNLAFVVRECSSYWDVLSAQGKVTRSRKGCRLLKEIWMNPDVIGDWNVPAGGNVCRGRTRTTKVRWVPPSPVRVIPSDPGNEKCLGMAVKLNHQRPVIGYPDEDYQLGSVCLTFHAARAGGAA